MLHLEVILCQSVCSWNSRTTFWRSLMKFYSLNKSAELFPGSLLSFSADRPTQTYQVLRDHREWSHRLNVDTNVASPSCRQNSSWSSMTCRKDVSLLLWLAQWNICYSTVQDREGTQTTFSYSCTHNCSWAQVWHTNIPAHHKGEQPFPKSQVWFPFLSYWHILSPA